MTLSAASRVLVVDDDPASRSFLEFALAKQGYAVVLTQDAADAEEQLTATGIASFSCVVTDYRMPDRSGLDLLAWLQNRDPTLATILVTAEGEKALVTESLRGGAVDYLEKPVELGRLRAAVARAIERTHRQRHLARSETAVQQLGRAQERMLGAEAARSPVRVAVCSHPKHEAGGDFFTRFRPAPDRFFCLLTDVSGHDLQAAYISAYFQGVVRGMLERAAPVEEIFAAFNRLLLEEWNHQPGGVGLSVAACAVALDVTAQTATVLTHGTPAPVYWRLDGHAQAIGQTGGFPLGWFSEFAARPVLRPVAAGGSFCLWTDGLAEVAEQSGVSELSLAWALQRAKARGETFAQVDSAADDILLADLHVSAEPAIAEMFRPVLLEQYRGDRSGDIDQFQLFWQRSLLLAAPQLPEATLHDVLLASREALLNALQHGCGGRAGQSATFQAAYCPARRTIRVRVSDPGPGHQFNLAPPEPRAIQDLAETHRGLLLIQHLATRLDVERNGASLRMDFSWP